MGVSSRSCRLPAFTQHGASDGRSRVRPCGWSLIELVVVVGVLAVLTLVALPTYRSATLRAQRFEAMTALASIAAAQERHFLQHHTYTSELASAPPAGLGISATTASDRYSLAITAADSATFTATATSQGQQARDTHCAEFGIDATGSRTATNDDCWTR